MGEIYGAAWVRQFGHVGESAFETWCRGLSDLSEDEIRRGTTKLLARESRYAPNLNEFRSLCTKDPAELGMPSADQAYIEACKKSGSPASARWSHPAVFVTGRNTGWFELRVHPERAMRPVFARNYEIVTRRVLAGEDLDQEIPEALPRKGQSSVRSSPEYARRKLRELRQGL